MVLDTDLPLGSNIMYNYGFQNSSYSIKITTWCFLFFIFILSITAFSSLEWCEALH